MPKTTSRVSKDKVLEAAKDSRGVISVIARRLGVARSHVYNLMDKYPELVDTIEEERESLKDSVEATMIKEMLGGWQEDPVSKQRVYVHPNTTLLIFWAKTQMRKRGYNEHMIPDDQILELSSEALRAMDALGMDTAQAAALVNQFLVRLAVRHGNFESDDDETPLLQG